MATNNILFDIVKEIEKEFITQVNINQTKAMHSRPSFAEFYWDMANNYEKGVEICKDYYEDENVMQLLHGLLKNGFFDEMLCLKNYVSNEALEVVKVAEKELDSVASLFQRYN